MGADGHVVEPPTRSGPDAPVRRRGVREVRDLGGEGDVRPDAGGGPGPRVVVRDRVLERITRARGVRVHRETDGDRGPLDPPRPEHVVDGRHRDPVGPAKVRAPSCGVRPVHDLCPSVPVRLVLEADDLDPVPRAGDEGRGRGQVEPGPGVARARIGLRLGNEAPVREPTGVLDESK